MNNFKRSMPEEIQICDAMSAKGENNSDEKKVGGETAAAAAAAAPAARLPAKLIILLDTSGSRWREPKNDKAALESLFNDHVKRAAEENIEITVSLSTFSSELHTIYENVPLQDACKNTLSKLPDEYDGNTRLYDSAGEIIEKLLAEKRQKNFGAVLVVITDGDNTCPPTNYTPTRVRELVQEFKQQNGFSTVWMSEAQTDIGTKLGFVNDDDPAGKSFSVETGTKIGALSYSVPAQSQQIFSFLSTNSVAMPVDPGSSNTAAAAAPSPEFATFLSALVDARVATAFLSKKRKL